MYLQKLMSNYTEYNQWANEATIQWLSGKPEADFYKKVASSYPSIILTLNHMLAVQEFWYAVISETEQENRRYLETEPRHEEIFSGLTKQSTLLNTYISTLSEADLLKEIELDMPWVKGTLSRYEFLQHVCNHSTYHRGQVVTIGRNLGYTDAPMTDYNFYNMAVLQRGVAVEGTY